MDEEKNKLRNKIVKLKGKRKEKHQKKIAELEQKLAGILQENKQEEPEKIEE